MLSLAKHYHNWCILISSNIRDNGKVRRFCQNMLHTKKKKKSQAKMKFTYSVYFFILNRKHGEVIDRGSD